MSADSSSSYLDHTLGYTYTPMDQVATVSTDGTQTESYTHDAKSNVTAQTVYGTSTTYGYSQGQMATATAGGSTADYNYDPFGRLDTVTAAGATLQSNTYDGFDNLASTTHMSSSGSATTTSYTYDSLNRMATQTTGAGTTSFSYLGASSQVASESDPGSTSKTYDYTPGGARLSQTTTSSSGTSTPGYYSYNAHTDVEALTGSSGTTTATYGYTAYGQPVTSMFTGADKTDATSSATSTTQPYSAYRFNAMRWDGTSGQYDMGFRNYDPGLNQFTSRDMYDGATQNMGLTADPFTGGQYAFGNGNPISNIEQDGHSSCPPPEINCGSTTSPSPSAYFTLPNSSTSSGGSSSPGGSLTHTPSGSSSGGSGGITSGNILRVAAGAALGGPPAALACLQATSLSCVVQPDVNFLKGLTTPPQCKPGTNKYACFAFQVILSGGMEDGAPEVPAFPRGGEGLGNMENRAVPAAGI
jgi:RHS repeat-associated protein